MNFDRFRKPSEFSILSNGLQRESRRVNFLFLDIMVMCVVIFALKYFVPLLLPT